MYSPPAFVNCSYSNSDMHSAKNYYLQLKTKIGHKEKRKLYDKQATKRQGIQMPQKA